MDRERFKQFFIDFHEPARTALIVAPAIFVLVLTGLLIWYLPPVMRAYAHAAEAQAKQLEANTISNDLNEGVKKLLAKLDTISDNALDASEAFKRTANNLEPQVQSIVKNTNDGLNELDLILEDIRYDTIPRINANLDSTRRVIDNSEPNVTEATGALAHSMKKLDAYISDEKVANWIDEQMKIGNSLMLKLDKIAGSATVIASNGEQISANGVEITEQGAKLSKSVTNFVDGYLNKKPRWYQKFILTPLKAVLGYGLTAYSISRQ